MSIHLSFLLSEEKYFGQKEDTKMSYCLLHGVYFAFFFCTSPSIDFAFFICHLTQEISTNLLYM